MKEYLLMIGELLFLFFVIWVMKQFVWPSMDIMMALIGYVFATAVRARNKAFGYE